MGNTETLGVAVRVGEIVGEPVTLLSLSAIHHNKNAASTTIIVTVIAVLMVTTIYGSAVETMKRHVLLWDWGGAGWIKFNLIELCSNDYY